jgi:acyl carrier protein
MAWPAEFEAILRGNLPLLDNGHDLSAGMPLVDYGLDSLATVGIILEVEETFAVSIPDEFLVPESFESPGSIWEMVVKLRSGDSGVAG